MPPTLPIDLANFPALRTRKALLVLDLQNEFLSSGGALPVSTPEGFVDRILNVAKAFRDSGSGDVFWIRSQFESPRPVAHSHIITSSSPQRPGSSDAAPAASRGRRRLSEPPSEDPDADPEAFLSVGSSSLSEKRQQQQQQQQPQRNLLPGSLGSELAPPVATSVNTRQDLILAKSHYSAFESTQLLMRLRTRFVTELYICGALTNISIYATALDAARHGLTLTIIEDCCGYRSALRHSDALSSLVQLTGCDTLLAEHVLESLTSQSSSGERPAGNDFAAAIAAITAASNGPPRARRSAQQASTGPVAISSGGGGSGSGASLPVRTKVPEPKEETAKGKVEEKGKEHEKEEVKEKEKEKEKEKVKEKEKAKESDGSPVPSPTCENPALSRPSPIAKVIAESDPQATQPLQTVVAPGPAAAAATSAAPTSHSSAAASKAATKPSPPLDLDPGEITPDDDQDDADDSFLQSLVLPSRKEKYLEYSRLRSMRTSNDIKRHLQDAAKASAAAREQHHYQQRTRVNRPKTTAPAHTAVTSSDDSSSQNIVPRAVEQANMASTESDKQEPGPVDSPEPGSATSRSPVDRSLAQERDVASATKSSAKMGGDVDAGPDAGPDADSDASLVQVDTTKQPAATETLCEGDTIIYHNVLPQTTEDGIYERLRDEVHWLRMSHQGGEVPRLVCVQGEVDDEGSIPIYRHPADESPPLEPFTPTVLRIKREVEKIVGHPLNHVLIQLYRTGNDYISEHSDKSLDIVQGSYVCNMSLGAERTMVFRTKRVDKDPSLQKPSGEPSTGTIEVDQKGQGAAEEEKPDAKKRQTVRVQLPHNSLCRMGLQTNMRWLHAIRQDKRLDRDKTPAELAFGGGRISLTFRQIGTFLNSDQTLIWGQGAIAKTRDTARPVINGQSDEAVRMLQAFGTENHSSTFDWAKHYGEGFDVLHMSNSPRFFASADNVVNMSIQLLLSELGIAYAKGSLGAPPPVFEKKNKDAAPTDVAAGAAPATPLLDLPVRFVDNDPNRSVVQGLLAILLYLDAVYGSSQKGTSAVRPQQAEVARKYTRLQQALVLQDKWRTVAEVAARTASSGDHFALPKTLKDELAIWNGFTSSEEGKEGDEKVAIAYIGGETTSKPSLADYVVWPVLHSIDQALADGKSRGDEPSPTALGRLGFAALARYYSFFKAQESVTRICCSGSK